MNTLDELLYYCKEIEPVGALLLTGEWGCGKTYLIDHKLKEELDNIAHVIRVSLFGISSIEGIHSVVKQAWISKCNENKKWKEALEKANQGKDIIGKLEFLPEWMRGIANTDWQSFVEVKNKIDEKPVILVFDDLERCCLDTVDVLGAINDYCENKKFHTIIVANQDKMQEEKDIVPTEVELICFDKEKSTDKPDKKILMKINTESLKENGELSYAEIKEKIIHRTVTYVPDYSEIVHTVISEMKYEDDTYKKCVEKCEGGLLEVFAPEREDNERPHNIRSFKCAIKDFYRVYNALREKEFDNLDKWFYSFTAYVIAAKANIAKEGAYGSFISDRYVKNLYPAFQEPYMISGIKNWIFNGTWDEEWIFFELERLKEQEKAKTPEDIVRTYRIIDVDEEVINTGFPNVLNMAYHGTLTLDEYVLFIENSYWARCYGFTFPISVEWDKVKKGIKHAIQLLIDSRQEGQSHHSIITDSNKQYFTEAEWDTYLIIEKFRDKNVLMFSNNKALYIEQMQEDAFSAFSICQNKRFDEFNEKMAVATAEAYAKMGNSDKHQFSGYFKKMWKSNIMSQDLKTEDTLVGFNILRDMLLEQKKHLEQENKVFAVCHTNDFIQYLDELIKTIKESTTTVAQT